MNNFTMLRHSLVRTFLNQTNACNIFLSCLFVVGFLVEKKDITSADFSV